MHDLYIPQVPGMVPRGSTRLRRAAAAVTLSMQNKVPLRDLPGGVAQELYVQYNGEHPTSD